MGILAENKKSIYVMTPIIETIAHCSVYKPNALKFAEMGVLKDLVLMISEYEDFRSEYVRISMEAIWNIIEVGGSEVT